MQTKKWVGLDRFFYIYWFNVTLFQIFAYWWRESAAPLESFKHASSMSLFTLFIKLHWRIKSECYNLAPPPPQKIRNKEMRVYTDMFLRKIIKILWPTFFFQSIYPNTCRSNSNKWICATNFLACPPSLKAIRSGFFFLRILMHHNAAKSLKWCCASNFVIFTLQDKLRHVLKLSIFGLELIQKYIFLFSSLIESINGTAMMSKSVRPKDLTDKISLGLTKK